MRRRRLNRRRQVQIAAESGHEIGRRNHVDTLLHCLDYQLETAADFFFGDARDGAHFLEFFLESWENSCPRTNLESTRDRLLAAGDVETCGRDGIIGATF